MRAKLLILKLKAERKLFQAVKGLNNMFKIKHTVKSISYVNNKL
jgi:hypothetical protein